MERAKARASEEREVRDGDGTEEQRGRPSGAQRKREREIPTVTELKKRGEESAVLVLIKILQILHTRCAATSFCKDKKREGGERGSMRKERKD